MISSSVCTLSPLDALSQMSLSQILSQAIELEQKPFADGLVFGKSPRYHNGLLYVSDMLGGKIYTIAADGSKSVLVEVPEMPNGMAFMPAGTLVYSSMYNTRLHRFVNGQSSLHADLSSVMTGYCGDMVIDRFARVYVDDVGFRVLHGEPRAPGRIIVVEPDGDFRVAAEGIEFANGIAIDCEGKHLYIAATFAKRLNSFDITSDGALVNRQEIWDWSNFDEAGEGCTIDGICIDAEDGIWMSLLAQEVFVRLDRNRNITHKVPVTGHATACTLGGEDGRTLYMVANQIEDNIFDATKNGLSRCKITTATVDIPRGYALP